MQTYIAPKKILVPVPLKGELSVPLSQALMFQQIYGSEIIILNVVSKYSIFHKLLNPKKLKKHHKRAKQKLKKLVKKYFNGKIPENVRLKVEDGTLISSILETVELEHYDLIIIKKALRFQSRLNFMKTENADKLIAESPCPVLSISSQPTPEKIETIMVPVEVMKASENKVTWAISLAKQFKAKVHLVSVLNVDIKPEKSLSYKRSRKIEYQMRRQGIDVEIEVLKPAAENPVQTILNHAAKLKPDLFVIMTRKETIIGDKNLGNFTREIIHNAHVPVLSVVPSRDSKHNHVFKSIPDIFLNTSKQHV